MHRIHRFVPVFPYNVAVRDRKGHGRIHIHVLYVLTSNFGNHSLLDDSGQHFMVRVVLCVFMVVFAKAEIIQVRKPRHLPNVCAVLGQEEQGCQPGDHSRSKGGGGEGITLYKPVHVICDLTP